MTEPITTTQGKMTIHTTLDMPFCVWKTAASIMQKMAKAIAPAPATGRTGTPRSASRPRCRGRTPGAASPASPLSPTGNPANAGRSCSENTASARSTVPDEKLVVIGTSRHADVVRVRDLLGCVTEASASRSAVLYSPVRLAATERAVRPGDGRGDVACAVAAESAAELKCACA